MKRCVSKILDNNYTFFQIVCKKFGAQYFDSPEILKEQIINKKIIPHQVEFQPGSNSKKICWLDCPYCYGISAIDEGERISEERSVSSLFD